MSKPHPWFRCSDPGREAPWPPLARSTRSQMRELVGHRGEHRSLTSRAGKLGSCLPVLSGALERFCALGAHRAEAAATGLVLWLLGRWASGPRPSSYLDTGREGRDSCRQGRARCTLSSQAVPAGRVIRVCTAAVLRVPLGGTAG